MKGVPIKRGNLETEIGSQGDCHVNMKGKMEWCFYKLRNTKDCQQTPEARGNTEHTFPVTSEGTNSTHTLVSDCSSQNSRIMNWASNTSTLWFCYAAPENEYTHLNTHTHTGLLKGVCCEGQQEGQTGIPRQGSAPSVLMAPTVTLRKSLIFSGFHFLYFSHGERQPYLSFLLRYSNRWEKKSLKIFNMQWIPNVLLLC